MNLQKIKELCEKKNYKLNQLAADINMSETNLHRCIRNNNIQAPDLEKIAIRLDVPINAFFDEAPEEGYKIEQHNTAVGEKAMEYMTKLLDEKDKVLIEKERFIQVLLKKEKE